MNRITVSLLAVSLVGQAAEYPEAEIAAQAILAKFHLPDPEKGYYRGTRFDWSGQIHTLRADGHDYFGQWFAKVDPKLHDSIMGPVEEFHVDGDTSIGYEEAKPGENFIRIGVGAVRKTDDKPYQRFQTYEIVNPGKWSIEQKPDRIAFRHELTDASGYAYVYTKTIHVDGPKPVMTIEHSLKNTGKKPLNTWQYNHNFFVFDKQPTGPEATVTFPFQLTTAGRAFNPDLAVTTGKQIQYKKTLGPGESAFSELGGFGSKASDYDIRVENRKSGTGVRIEGDRPIKKIVYWSITTTLCPEAYIDVSTQPGAETRWKYKYTFYNLK
ncbi:MAG: hypothetical protein H7039_17955 [Bryobacteraceae bacterium]|nr:hypothetical protein [Bryobacteraceae bacterium]